jgi:hypothetical protein
MPQFNLPTLASSVKGRFKIDTHESRHLAALRREALALVSDLPCEGSALSWRALPADVREQADQLLARLVEQNRDTLLADPQVDDVVNEFAPNLLLNVGLNNICSHGLSPAYWAHKSSLGVGTTPTVYDSAAITATASGTGCTASSAFFTTGMVGMLIRWDSGEEAYISSRTSDTVVVLDRSTTASGAFAVWAVNQTGLASHVRTTESGRNAWVVSRASGTSTFRNFWDHDLETANQVYTEGGILQCGGAGDTYLSRFLIAGGSVTVLIGQQARVTYEYDLTVTTAAVPGTWAVDGWPVAGVDDTDGQYKVLTQDAVDGAIENMGRPHLVPGYDHGLHLYLSTATTLPAYTDDTTRPALTGSVGGAGLVSEAYVANTFYRDATAYFNGTTGNSTSIRTVSLYSYSPYSGSWQCWAFLFDHAQTKADGYGLTLRFRRALNRVLVNP